MSLKHASMASTLQYLGQYLFITVVPYTPCSSIPIIPPLAHKIHCLSPQPYLYQNVASSYTSLSSQLLYSTPLTPASLYPMVDPSLPQARQKISPLTWHSIWCATRSKRDEASRGELTRLNQNYFSISSLILPSRISNLGWSWWTCWNYMPPTNSGSGRTYPHNVVDPHLCIWDVWVFAQNSHSLCNHWGGRGILSQLEYFPLINNLSDPSLLHITPPQNTYPTTWWTHDLKQEDPPQAGASSFLGEFTP